LNKELPEGWVWTTVGNSIIKISTSGKKLKQKDYLEEGNLPVVDQGQLEVGGYTNLDGLKINVNTPVIIFGDHTKIFKYINYDFVPGADGIKVLKPIVFYNPKLFYYFLQVIELPDKGYARHFQYLEKGPIPLPPLAEQQRIVNKIEELFANLDKGIEYLKTAQAELKLTRQSVLKYAMEGKLTEKWREENKDNIEPASALLEKIKESKEGRYKELPCFWKWVALENITLEVRKINPKENPNVSFIYLDIASIDNKNQKIKNPKFYLGKDAPSRARQLVKEGDILLSTVRTYLRNIALVPKEFDNQVASTGFCVLRLANGNSKWLFYLVQNDEFLDSLTEMQRGTNYPAVRNSDILSKIIPFPPIAEQNKIVEEIETYYSILDNMENTISQSLHQTSSIRQSILKKAFQGKLVPQDPNDEPASILLERIKAEKNSKIKKEKYQQLRID
jgi:type I restriction enzyme S subunit